MKKELRILVILIAVLLVYATFVLISTLPILILTPLL